MAFIYDREFTKRELMKRVGDISQIAGARHCILESGKARGVKAVDVKNGNGLDYTILPDRGMDIAWAAYKGKAFGFISKTGVGAPAYFEPEGLAFLRNFHAGLLTTCGLTYMGAPCEDEGEQLGLHGRISNIPAEDICVTNEWQGDDFVMKVRGRMRESIVFGEHIVLTREIETRLGENRIIIRDEIENCGYDRQPLMLLYHFNFGFPLFDRSTRLVLPEGTAVKARDDEAAKGIDICREFDDPVHGYKEQVFYYDVVAQADGTATAKLINGDLGEGFSGIYLTYNKNQLPYFTEWKQIGEGDYVVGLEPATWHTEGRRKARERGELEFIEPGAVKKVDLEIGIIEE